MTFIFQNCPDGSLFDPNALVCVPDYQCGRTYQHKLFKSRKVIFQTCSLQRPLENREEDNSMVYITNILVPMGAIIQKWFLDET